jgi:hypothetical protein
LTIGAALSSSGGFSFTGRGEAVEAFPIACPPAGAFIVAGDTLPRYAALVFARSAPSSPIPGPAWRPAYERDDPLVTMVSTIVTLVDTTEPAGAEPCSVNRGGAPADPTFATPWTHCDMHDGSRRPAAWSLPCATAR